MAEVCGGAANEVIPCMMIAIERSLNKPSFGVWTLTIVLFSTFIDNRKTNVTHSVDNHNGFVREL